MPGWVAVAPAGRRAHAVQVDWPEGAGRPQLRWACEIDWSDPARGLRQLDQRHPLTQARRVAVLQRHQYQLLPLDAPDVPREAWPDAVRWKLKDMVDFAVEDAGIDLLDIPPDTSQRGRSGLLVAAAPQAELLPLVHAGQDAALPWRALDVAETALRNLSNLSSAQGDDAGRAQALLGVGDSGSWLVVTAFGELLLARQIEITRAQACSAADAPERAQWERVALELQRTLDHCDRLFNRVSLKRLLVGPGLDGDFLDYLRELVYLPVQACDLAELVDLSQVPELRDDPAEQTRYLCAIGAALRPLAD
jgi:MSHA biogenesis protein MshI